MKRKVMTVMFAATLLSGCVTMPPDTFRVTENVLQLRALDTKRYEGSSREKMYSAAAGVLQDMGFTLTETQAGLGLLVGTKDRSAVEAGQVVGIILVALLGGQPQAMDKNQRFFASVVVADVLDEKGNAVPGQFAVRATFSRKVWNTQEQLTRAELLRDPELYSGFFDKLSKSAFLEAHSI
jgi:hypothetical protein